MATGPPGRVCSETDPGPWPRTWRGCFFLCHVRVPAAGVKAPVPAGPPPPSPPPYLIVKGARLLPQVFGSSKVLQALGLAQGLQRHLHVQAAEDVFQEVHAGRPVRWSWGGAHGLPRSLLGTLCLAFCAVRLLEGPIGLWPGKSRQSRLDSPPEPLWEEQTVPTFNLPGLEAPTQEPWGQESVLSAGVWAVAI